MNELNEATVEYGLIGKLKDLKYVYRTDIRDKQALEQNFKQKFEALNSVKLSDAEFSRLKDEIISNDVFKASKTLRQVNTFYREDGTPLQFSLVNLKDWCKNDFEVVNQITMHTNDSYHRYDVLILLNGIPVLQIELKGYNINPRTALEQISKYKQDAGNGYTNSLLCFVQLFVVSNTSNTYYYCNNLDRHFKFNADEQFIPVYQWADRKNNKITNLYTFADLFLAKCTLAETISRYMVLVESEQKLMVMRPYQVYAVKEIVKAIEDNRGNGFVWHTTGSGKTLTSFKASTLLKDNPAIEKCLFVVDRKDLDRQTREEFNKFQEGCVEENTNTHSLVRRLLSDNYADKVIVTTIQKLGLALDPNNQNKYKEKLEPLSKKRLVFIFDECHRSQFGENHKAIKEFFPNSQLFGFTGTPIFDDNSNYKRANGQEGFYQTTESIFKNCLHEYTITHAIEDKNVLQFHIDFFKPETANRPEFNTPEHKKAVANAILEKHEAATKNRKFNAIFATSSINEAIEYYQLFIELQKERKQNDEDYSPLNIACIFSPPAEVSSDAEQQQQDLQQEKEDYKTDPVGKKLHLNNIIRDYNKQFGTNHSIYEFDKYYQDIQKRIKDQQYPNTDYPQENKIDITIVVDMLLTGFDAKYLNTLYVDKNLSYHGLIQAYSRTNRVLNDTKPRGNILDFRAQREAVDKAITRFSGVDLAEKAREIWLVEPAPIVIKRYEEAVNNLATFMGKHGLENTPDQVNNIRGERAKIEFIETFKEVQKIKVQLDQYTDLTPEQKETIQQIMPEQNIRGFKGMYLEKVKEIKALNDNKPKKEGKETSPPVDFQLVLFASAKIDYDYIMELIAKFIKEPTKQKMNKQELLEMLKTNANLMDDQEMIARFIDSLEMNKPLPESDIKQAYKEFREQYLNKELDGIAEKHTIDKEGLHSLVQLVLNRNVFDAEKLSELFANRQIGWKERTNKEKALLDDLVPYLMARAQGREIAGLSHYLNY